MSSFLKDLPCRNPSNFTRIQATGAIRQISVRPTYTARLDSNAQEIINDPVSLLVHRLSLIPKNDPRKPTIVEDGSEVPIALLDQTELAKQSATITNHPNEDLC
ncbi:unnamed protein product [Adineta ricciae]|uniref:DET1- and DDB1-associated protein 1 domain-containing protein n=1 Tax=Adineta ricciae TaxID=249248 RepID=A0A813YVI7_ADIRI|nr:unnamed protein product [Adineta ricciae]CAF1042581.1 unnamed protein product [Adineta ricciae]